MKRLFDILMEERENKIEALETIDSIIKNMQNQTIEIIDNQLQIMDNFLATAQKLNKKDGQIGISLDENGISIGHEKAGFNLLMLKFKVCLNTTFVAFINFYADMIKIVIKEKEHTKLAFELNRQASKYKNLSNDIRSIYDAKRELYKLRDQQ